MDPQPHVIHADTDSPAYQRRGVQLAGGDWQRKAAAAINQHLDVQTTPTFRWTDALPTKEGWYFNRPKVSPNSVTVLLVVEVEEAPYGSGFQALDPSGLYLRMVETMPDQWAGPIPVPLD